MLPTLSAQRGDPSVSSSCIRPVALISCGRSGNSRAVLCGGVCTGRMSTPSCNVRPSVRKNGSNTRSSRSRSVATPRRRNSTAAFWGRSSIRFSVSGTEVSLRVSVSTGFRHRGSSLRASCSSVGAPCSTSSMRTPCSSGRTWCTRCCSVQASV